MKKLDPKDNKFSKGNKKDGRHYWLTPKNLFDFDPAPHPKPEGKKKGPTAWARKAIKENEKGKRVVMVYPIDKWVLMMIKAGAKIENLGDVKWCATEDGLPGKGTGRHIACFILEGTENEK